MIDAPTSSSPSSRTRTRTRWPERLVLLLGLGLLAATSSWANRPARALFPPRVLALDVSTAVSDGGIAWRVPLALDPSLPSDRDGGRSLLSVFEDGVPLQPHAVHQALRDGATGRCSHWGDVLYLTATDGSDPRTNGRAYSLTLPVEVPGWTTEALLTSAGVGVLLVLFALVLPGLRARSVAQALPGLAAAAVGALLVARSAWFESLRTLELAEQDGAVAHASPSPARAREASIASGNVTRLLPGSPDARFEAAGALPSFDDARRVPLVARAGVVREGDLVRLQPGGPGLVAQLDPPVALADLAELVLPARVLEGGTLELRLIDASEPDRQAVQVALQVEARDGVQALSVLQPFALYVGRDDVSIGRIELLCPFTTARACVLDVPEVVVAGAAARFLRAPEGEGPLSQGHELRPARWQSVPGRFTIPLAGDGSLVKGAVALFGRPPDGPVRVHAVHVDDAGREHPLFDETLDDLGAWRDLRADLARVPGARLDTLRLSVPDLPPGTAVAWANWRLVDTSRPARRVLVVLLDTLRADALSAFGGEEARTPVLDALAADGARFLRCYAQAHWTRPSMPSIMTSRYVAATGVDTVGQQLPSSYVTLAEAFADAGFLTVADVANTNAGPSSGLGQGWDTLRLYGQPRFGSAREQLLDGDLGARLSAAGDEDLLLYVHLMDAHGPYGPYLAPDEAGPGGGDELPRNDAFDRDWIERPTAEGRRYWYMRDVEAMDAALGDFLELLATQWGEEGRRALTYAVLADHGEYLGEHGQWGHGWHALLPEVVHVPLLLGGPALEPGRSVRAPVENLDLAPTLLELAGLPVAALPDADGRSLLPLLRGDDDAAHRVAVAGVRLGRNEQLSIYGAHGALLGDQRRLVNRLSLDDAGAHGVALSYTGFEAAPESARDDESLIAREVRSALTRRFEDFWTTYDVTGAARRSPLWEAADDEPLEVDPVALRQLQALGYVER